MTGIIVGSVVLSTVHAAIPSHWLPVIAFGRSEKWSRGETMWVAGIAGTAHTLSTILIGIMIGLAGYKLSSIQRLTTSVIAPSLLFLVGSVYLGLDLRRDHRHKNFATGTGKRRSKFAIVSSLSVAMFLSPCMEIDAYFFSAGTHGPAAIAVVSLVYLVLTVLGMVVLVDLGRKGVERVRWRLIEHHERKVSGVILMILGVATFFFHF